MIVARDSRRGMLYSRHGKVKVHVDVAGRMKRRKILETLHPI